MARTFPAGLQTVLNNGGALYWLVYVDRDNVTPANRLVFCNIRSVSNLTGTLMTDRLISIGDVDIYGNMLEPLARIADTSFSIQDLSDTIDPSDYVGKKITIDIGFGTSIDQDDFTTLYTGKIYDFSIKDRIYTFKVRGKSQLQDKVVGKTIPETADEKYRGKIYPIVHGDWSDLDAYAPLFIDKAIDLIPSVVTGEHKIKSLTNFYFYDPELRISYRALKKSDDGTVQWILNSDNTIAEFKTDTTATLTTGVDAVNPTVLFDTTLIDFTELSTGEPPAQTVIQIDSELMIVLKVISANEVTVDRGAYSTEATAHNTASLIYQIDNDFTQFLIKTQNIFYAKALSGYAQMEVGGRFSVEYTPFKNRYALVDIDVAVADATNAINNVSFPAVDYVGYNVCALVFDRIGIEATVNYFTVIYKAKLTSRLNGSGAGDTGRGRLILDCDGVVTSDASALLVNSLSGDTAVVDQFDNTNGVDEKHRVKTDFNFDIDLTTDLNGKTFGARLEYKHLTTVTASPNNAANSLLLSKIGFRLDFSVSPRKYNLYWRGQGRENPGGYFNGSSGDLIENPSSVIEDLCRNDIQDMTYSNLNETSFDNFFTDKTSYKLSTAVYTKESKLPKFREVLSFYLKNCNGLSFEDYDGKLNLISYDAPGSVTRTIDDSEILVSSNKLYKANWSYTPVTKIITKIEIRYKPILAVDDEYASLKFCLRSGDTEASEISNFLSEESEYSGYLQTAYDLVGEERPLNIVLDGVRDEATAELIAKQLIELLIKPLVILELECTYKSLDVDFGDKIGTDIDVLPTDLNAKTWLVIGKRIVPSVGKNPMVKLKLLELGTATIEEPTDIQDTYAVGTDIQDTYATGDVIQGVY